MSSIADRNGWHNPYNRLLLLLLDHHVDVNKPVKAGRTSLCYIALTNDVRVAELLLARGADVNAESDRKSGMMPLHFAAYYGKDEMVKILLSRGAKKGIQTKTGLTALEIARQRGYRDIAKLLE